MRATIVVTMDGRLSAVTREGTFAEGKARLLALAGRLRAAGVELPALSDLDFEQHRHDMPVQGVRQDERACH